MYSVKELPSLKYPSMSHLKYLCPRCNGTGMLGVNHACFNCMQWGYVESECAHEFNDTATVGKCLTEYQCTKCSFTRVVDSSD